MMTCGERGVPAQSHDRVLAPFIISFKVWGLQGTQGDSQ